MSDDHLGLSVAKGSKIVRKAMAEGRDPAVFVATEGKGETVIELWLSEIFKGERRWHLWDSERIKDADEPRLEQIENEMLEKAWPGYSEEIEPKEPARGVRGRFR